jgi:hypothetical protein
MKTAVFWDVAQCRSGVKRLFLLLTSLSDALRADFLIFPLYPEVGGDTFLRNIG